MAKKREANVFSLSFLDIMSCGLGAVILIFIVIQHGSEANSQEANLDLLAAISKIEEQVQGETEHLVDLKNTLEEKQDTVASAEDIIRQLIQQIRELEQQLLQLQTKDTSQSDTIKNLKQELKQLQAEATSLQDTIAEQTGQDNRTFVGDGDRQYLTGVNLGGEHILILIDTSASMLDNTIIDVIRRRNMSNAQKLASAKWQRAINTIDWIIANVPRNANLQLFGFNNKAFVIIPGSKNSWIAAKNREAVNQALALLRETVPTGGTSLHHPFELTRQLTPNPDSIFLIVDSLPTMSFTENTKPLIASQDRVKLFASAMDELPQNIPVNVILFPMEGDPIAAPNYWRLAQITGGAFLSPPEDWP